MFCLPGILARWQKEVRTSKIRQDIWKYNVRNVCLRQDRCCTVVLLASANFNLHSYSPHWGHCFAYTLQWGCFHMCCNFSRDIVFKPNDKWPYHYGFPLAPFILLEKTALLHERNAALEFHSNKISHDNWISRWDFVLFSVHGNHTLRMANLHIRLLLSPSFAWPGEKRVFSSGINWDHGNPKCIGLFFNWFIRSVTEYQKQVLRTRFIMCFHKRWTTFHIKKKQKTLWYVF